MNARETQHDSDLLRRTPEHTAERRERGNITINFGVPNIPGRIGWRNAEGYLPALVSTFEKAGLQHKITSFADDVTFEGTRIEVAYSRMTTTNTGTQTLPLPQVSG